MPLQTWLESHEKKNLIAFAGLIKPLISKTLQEELKKNLKAISEQLTENFFAAYYGKLRESNQAATIWEFSLSPAPITFNGKRLRIGQAVLAYQLPKEAAGLKLSPPTTQEKEKFIRQREKFFVDYLKEKVLSNEALEEISTLLTETIHDAIEEPGTTIGNQAKVVWSLPVTSGKGKRKHGRMLLALKLPAIQEDHLEKVIQQEPAKDSGSNNDQSLSL